MTLINKRITHFVRIDSILGFRREMKSRNLLNSKVIVKARGLVCPVPLIRLQQQMEQLSRGDIAELIADDPGIGDDLPVWIAATGHRLVQMRCDPGGVWVAHIEKC
jgi:tRNA 2-thiouridine synthesizing protein A